MGKNIMNKQLFTYCINYVLKFAFVNISCDMYTLFQYIFRFFWDIFKVRIYPSKYFRFILDFLKNSPSFIQFTQTLRYFKDITEHYILRENIFEKNKNEEEENEEEKFQLLYIFCHMVKRRISRFPNPSPSQICKWISAKMIILGDDWSFLHPIDV